jgi:hypothetical protein
VARTKITVGAAVSLGFPPASRVQSLRLLEDLQLVHGSSFHTPIVYARPNTDPLSWIEKCNFEGKN